MDVGLQEEENQTPLRSTQHACLLIGAGGTGKTTVILELMLDVFCHFFLARPFFFACAVRARSSDGHQYILSDWRFPCKREKVRR